MNLKSLTTAAWILLFLIGCAPEESRSDADPSVSADPQLTQRSPLEVVNQRMGAYNDHDLSSFMAAYAEDIGIFTYPAKSLGKGKKHLRSIFEPMFEEGTVQVEVHHQIAKDSYVVNHETVREGEKATEYVSIYEVRNGLIQSVSFVRD